MQKNSITATIAFIVTALIAAILIVSAFVLFLGEIIGSHLLAMVIVGGGCAIAAWVIYTSSLRPIIQKLEEQITTIYEVAHAARQTYEWALKYIISYIMRIK